MWKKIRKIIIFLLVIFEILILTGGSGQNSRMYLWLGRPTSELLKYFENIFSGPNALGWSIILLTAIFQLILFPLRYDMQKSSNIQQAKIAKLQPQLKIIQEKQKVASTPEEKMALSQAMMSVYKENNVSLVGGVNFLTLLIQMPIISGLYSSIRTFNEVKTNSFFGFPLGDPSFLLALIAGVLYFIQAIMMLNNNDSISKEQKSQVMMMSMISPVMIFIFAMVSSAALGLYFVVGGIFMIFLSLISTLNKKKQVEKGLKDFNVKNVVSDIIEIGKHDEGNQEIEDLAVSDIIENNNDGSKRNAGKQKR